MSAATLVRDRLPGFSGHAALYRIDPPITYTSWPAEHEISTDLVVVSATVVPFSGPETYIFPGTSDGKVADWGELPGSLRGTLDHAEALTAAGYEVAS